MWKKSPLRKEKKKKNSCSFKVDVSRTELPAAGCWVEQAMWRTGQSVLTRDWHHSWRAKVTFTGQQKLLSYWIECWIKGRRAVSIVPQDTPPAPHSISVLESFNLYLTKKPVETDRGLVCFSPVHLQVEIYSEKCNFQDVQSLRHLFVVFFFKVY